ncbi:MAG: hypothetical protein LBH85_06865 [Treponema sp.]|nr:hypothetical protein [Treponema sp.]
MKKKHRKKILMRPYLNAAKLYPAWSLKAGKARRELLGVAAPLQTRCLRTMGKR